MIEIILIKLNLFIFTSADKELYNYV